MTQKRLPRFVQTARTTLVLQMIARARGSRRRFIGWPFAKKKGCSLVGISLLVTISALTHSARGLDQQSPPPATEPAPPPSAPAPGAPPADEVGPAFHPDEEEP